MKILLMVLALAASARANQPVKSRDECASFVLDAGEIKKLAAAGSRRGLSCVIVNPHRTTRCMVQAIDAFLVSKNLEPLGECWLMKDTDAPREGGRFFIRGSFVIINGAR